LTVEIRNYGIENACLESNVMINNLILIPVKNVLEIFPCLDFFSVCMHYFCLRALRNAELHAYDYNNIRDSVSCISVDLFEFVYSASLVFIIYLCMYMYDVFMLLYIMQK